jgi:hypothetical protein
MGLGRASIEAHQPIITGDPHNATELTIAGHSNETRYHPHAEFFGQGAVLFEIYLLNPAAGGC